jgi:hypothetical protein
LTVTVTVFESVVPVPALVQFIAYWEVAAGALKTLPDAPPVSRVVAPFLTMQEVRPTPPVQFHEILTEAEGGMKRAVGEAEKVQTKGETQEEPMGLAHWLTPEPPTIRQVLFWHSRWVWREGPHAISEAQVETPPPALFTQEREDISHTPWDELPPPLQSELV